MAALGSSFAANAADFDGVKAFATATATWWLLGPADRFPDLLRTRPFNYSMDALQAYSGSLESFVLNLKDIVVSAKGDAGVLEIELLGLAADGRVYTNTALIKFKLDKRGKITEAREYLDLVASGEFMGITL